MVWNSNEYSRLPFISRILSKIYIKGNFKIWNQFYYSTPSVRRLSFGLQLYNHNLNDKSGMDFQFDYQAFNHNN